MAVENLDPSLSGQMTSWVWSDQ